MFDARTPAYLLQRVFTDNGIDTLIANIDPTILTYLKFPNKLTSIPTGLA